MSEPIDAEYRELEKREEKREVALGQPVGMLTKETVEKIEAQVDLYKRVKVAILRITDDEDWQDFDGKAYLTDSGIQKVARVAGVEFGVPKISEERGEDEEGKPWIRFVCELDATWRGIHHSDIGASATTDKFFAIVKKERVPFDKIDINSVRKKCITNAQGRVLRKLLGIGGMTWGQLAAAGINRKGAGAVRFGDDKRQDGAGRWSPDKDRLQNMLLELHGGDKEQVKETLLKTFRGEKDSVRSLTWRQVNGILPQVQRDYDKAFPKSEGEAQEEPGANG